MVARPGGTIDFRVRLPNDLRQPQTIPREYTERYDAVLDTASKSAATMNDLLRKMEASGVTHSVIHAEYEYGDPVDMLNEAVANAVGRAPQLLSGFGTVSLDRLQVKRMVRQVGHVFSLGLWGVNLQPSFFGIPMTDPRLYPVYSRAAEAGLVVALHSGINYTTHQVMQNDHPRQFDQLACDFPDLTIVACHAGWPWVDELVAIMRKHPNVYADFGGLAPKYVGEANTGWGVMYRFMNSLLAQQVLFATDWPVFSIDRALSEWRNLSLKAEVLEALLGGNARRLLMDAQSQRNVATGNTREAKE